MKVTTQYGDYYNVCKLELIDSNTLLLYYLDGDTQAISVTDLISIEVDSE